MPFKSNNRYLVRFYWYDRRISLEAHHSLGDGTGGMYLLQTVTAVYLRLLGHEISNGGFVLDVNETPDPEEFEDAYMRYANARVCPPRPAEKTYRVRGTKEPFYTLNVIDGIMSVSAVQKVAKQYQASITEYLNAVLLYSLLQKQEHDFHLRLRPVRIAMPVNLRRFFHPKRCATLSRWFIRLSIQDLVTTPLKKLSLRCTTICATISTASSCAAISQRMLPRSVIP